MKRRWQTVFKSVLFVLFILQLFHLIYRTIIHTYHYPSLLGTYCFSNAPPLGYVANTNVNDTLNIEQCSWENIDTCQRIHNQTFLFQLHWTAGFASELNNVIRAFIYAISTRRRFLIDDHFWNYGTFSALFNVTQGSFSPWLPSSPYCFEREFVHLIHYQSSQISIPAHLIVARDIDGGFSSLNLMMRSLENNDQVLKVRRAVTHYLWKTLNNPIKDFIDKHLKTVEWNNITYGIHIRQGDKLTKEAKKLPMEDYIRGLENFIAKNPQTDGKHQIFVASDSDHVISELQNLRPRWEFVQLPRTISHRGGHNQQSFNRQSSHTKLELTRLLLAELEMLSRVNYVVCTFSSNICRLVQTLREQSPHTVLSLDQQWHPY